MKTHTRVRDDLFQDVNGSINCLKIVDNTTTTIFVPVKYDTGLSGILEFDTLIDK